MGRVKKVQLDNIVNDITNSINNADNIKEKNYDNDKINSEKDNMKRLQDEMLSKQITNVNPDKKLRISDIQRIIKNTDKSIFNDDDECVIWNGYVTNLKNKQKGTYINFYFKDKKKVALHRILYANFVGQLNDKHYIKYSCNNKGKCCNINHMIKYEYNNDTENKEKKKSKKSKKKKKTDFDLDITFF